MVSLSLNSNHEEKELRGMKSLSKEQAQWILDFLDHRSSKHLKKIFPYLIGLLEAYTNGHISEQKVLSNAEYLDHIQCPDLQILLENKGIFCYEDAAREESVLPGIKIITKNKAELIIKLLQFDLYLTGQKGAIPSAMNKNINYIIELLTCYIEDLTSNNQIEENISYLSLFKDKEFIDLMTEYHKNEKEGKSKTEEKIKYIQEINYIASKITNITPSDINKRIIIGIDLNKTNMPRLSSRLSYNDFIEIINKIPLNHNHIAQIKEATSKINNRLKPQIHIDNHSHKYSYMIGINQEGNIIMTIDCIGDYIGGKSNQRIDETNIKLSKTEYGSYYVLKKIGLYQYVSSLQDAIQEDYWTDNDKE